MVGGNSHLDIPFKTGCLEFQVYIYICMHIHIYIYAHIHTHIPESLLPTKVRHQASLCSKLQRVEVGPISTRFEMEDFFRGFDMSHEIKPGSLTFH